MTNGFQASATVGGNRVTFHDLIAGIVVVIAALGIVALAVLQITVPSELGTLGGMSFAWLFRGAADAVTAQKP